MNRPHAQPAGPDFEVGRFALRTFRINPSSGELFPVSWYAHAPVSRAWAGGSCIAACAHRPPTLPWTGWHSPPHIHCRCGIYAFSDLETLRRQYPTAESLVAVIALEGAVIEGVSGYRAQAARIVGLWTHPHVVDARLREQISRNAPDAVWYGDIDAMIAAFPGLRHMPTVPASTAPMLPTSPLATWTAPFKRTASRVMHRSLGVGLLTGSMSAYTAASLATLPTHGHPLAGALVDVARSVEHAAILAGSPAGVLKFGIAVWMTALLAALAMFVAGLKHGQRIGRLAELQIEVAVACALIAALHGQPAGITAALILFFILEFVLTATDPHWLRCIHGRGLTGPAGLFVTPSATVTTIRRASS